MIAVGGDSVGFEDGILVRNGRPVTEPYTADFLDGVYYGPDVVPPGMLYLLGDNRLDSVDSRHFGPVPVAAVVGRIDARLFPPRPAAGSCVGRRGAWYPTYSRRKELHMAADDKIDAKADQLKGKVKEGVGRATDDRDLEAEGHGDQAKGNLKQAGEKIKDVFKS